ncbi:MAG: hypothetical protein JNN12_12785 [Bacteroidetes Order II. Incertae sedis bacterium]|nr:hypothetical protein [Bacteroidetes Order II. bacterium]
MRKHSFWGTFVVLLLSLVYAPDIEAQATKKSSEAFAKSLLLPGWGQQYLQNGSWKGKASAFIAADAGLWLGFISSLRRHNYYTQASYNHAQIQAGISLVDKDRAFMVRIGNYDRSEDYVFALELARRWGQLEAAKDPENAWAWSSTEARAQYSTLRDQAEAMRRQRILFTGLLVGNRLFSAISASRGVRKANKTMVQFSAPDGNPSLSIQLKF